MARPENSRLQRLIAVGQQHWSLPRVETNYEKLEVLLAMIQASRMNKEGRKFITISLPEAEYERLGQVAEQFSTRRRQVALVTVAKAGINLVLDACERAVAEKNTTEASRAAELLLENLEDVTPGMKRKLRDALRRT